MKDKEKEKIVVGIGAGCIFPFMLFVFGLVFGVRSITGYQWIASTVLAIVGCVILLYWAEEWK